MGLNYEPPNDGPTTTKVMQAGGIVIELMVDVTSNPQNTWTTSDLHSINCFLLHDKDGMSNGALEATPGENREWAFIVDTSTMEIVWRAFGSLGGQAIEESSAVQGLVEMCNRLGC